jgi:hypothetical protein
MPSMAYTDRMAATGEIADRLLVAASRLIVDGPSSTRCCLSRFREADSRTAQKRTLVLADATVLTHRITSSALSRIDCGMVMPSALAVLILTSRSNFVGCSIGRSPGLAPFSILSTNTAPCFHRS